ncbi:Paraquat-inducible protein A [Hoeflea sp. IMCC20628]|uniref:paraquat-inducible protein A n=1 Tax=Hoeflea sp. IMCC20628 TaxID=1620421 RepID=UPI00063AC916|nr:paraquat-inducible protein A [Hoeflea sp. IMCC20628]AKI02579.1 Paraquat-inducible protein A [Hoeflea sp. IMCC20628]
MAETDAEFPRNALPGAVHLGDLIACPHCDALYTAHVPASGEQAVCARCHTVLIAPIRKAGLKIIALTVAMLILIVSAVFFPFLNIEVSGFTNQASILDTALSFRSGLMALLAVATAAMVVLIPALRLLLVLYVLTPIVRDRVPYRYAKSAFGLSQRLKPWAMAEIFAIGCAVALVKVAALASIGFGPAFWMFTAFVFIVLVSDNFYCTWSVWKSLEHQQD